MELFEAITTLRSMRRLNARANVRDEDLRILVTAAQCAPNGAGLEPVRWLIVRDPAKRKALGQIYRECELEALDELKPLASSNSNVARMMGSALHLAEHMGDAPVIALPCAGSDD